MGHNIHGHHIEVSRRPRPQNGKPPRAPAEPAAVAYHHQCRETQRSRSGHEQEFARYQRPEHERRACCPNVQELPVERPVPSRSNGQPETTSMRGNSMCEDCSTETKWNSVIITAD